jgi:hypothetical protein
MKKYMLLGFCLIAFQFFWAQEVADFENLLLSENSYLNGSSGVSSFQSGAIELKVDYNAEWETWAGWAISNISDNQSPGFSNQYSAIPGQGAMSSNVYAISYASDGATLKIIEPNTAVEGLYITNSTYAYFSMLNGDSFAKQFGGESGIDPDYFSLTIKGYQNGVLSEDSVVVFLADYRFEDNEQDYILDEWIWVDLEILDATDSLQFTLHSSDTGSFGINTPTYFCIDQLSTKNLSGTEQSIKSGNLSILTNPITDELVIKNQRNAPMQCSLFDVKGNFLFNIQVETNIHRMLVNELGSGIYYIKAPEQETLRFIKL